MKALLNLLLGLVGAGIVAAIVLFFMTRADEEEEAAPPAENAVVRMSTQGVVANIERKLEAKSGRPLEVRCPKKVDESIGTTFRCSVRAEGGRDRIAIASVEIRGAGGQFGWTSRPVEAAAPAP
ncbi:hypothetical protein GEV27_17450 [Aeromicrobium sp. S22]|uniref:hypothetical protein n=1 Tax=Aeromicrobium sp. S22 TaxID=2662029 RepID=UPI00129DCD0B|nr:hypothetical protein [Aeromicrobium sp. S22]MRK03301.1 hypothetical protein [Aeromicrobium sp. S22]